MVYVSSVSHQGQHRTGSESAVYDCLVEFYEETLFLGRYKCASTACVRHYNLAIISIFAVFEL